MRRIVAAKPLRAVELLEPRADRSLQRAEVVVHQLDVRRFAHITRSDRQSGDRCVVIAEFLQDRVGVLAEQRRAMANGRRRFRHADRRDRDRRRLVQSGEVHAREQLRRANVFVVERFLRRQHLAAR